MASTGFRSLGELRETLAATTPLPAILENSPIRSCFHCRHGRLKFCSPNVTLPINTPFRCHGMALLTVNIRGLFDITYPFKNRAIGAPPSTPSGFALVAVILVRSMRCILGI